MVGSVTNGYAANPYLTTTAAPTTATTTSTSGDASGAAAARTSGSSVNVTLSAQAQAALAAQTDNRTTDQVVASARTALDKLLAGAKSTSALKDGKATIDVSGLDRRSLYAIASNKGG